jgi:hypothetical protein
MIGQLSAKEKRQYEEWLDLCKRISQGNEPLVETETQKRKRIKRLLDPVHFEEFIHFYFEDKEQPLAPLAWFHKQAIDDIYLSELDAHIWEWHRESAKSVFGDIFLPIHRLVRGELSGLILASENEDKAKNLIKDVEAQLRNNRRLISDFGDFGITGTWLQGYFQTKEGIGFWAFGLGQNPAGVRNGFKRPNMGIVDDADNKDAAKNQKRTKERADWIKGEFMGCLSTHKSLFLYINNRVHKHGLTAHMVGDLEEGDPKNEEYNHIKVYFTEDPDTHEKLMPDEGGVPAWRENFTIEQAIRKIKKMGYRNSQRQLYHNHIEEGNIFTDENMPWVDILPLHEYDALISYCDPAFGDSGKGCFRAIGLIGRKGLDYDVIWTWVRQTGNFAKAHYRLAQLVKENHEEFYNNGYKSYRPVSCQHWVESNELQKRLLKNIYRDENAVRQTPWYPKFDMDAKADKIGRVESLEPLAENGHLRFNQAMRTNKDMTTLRDQFKAFPNGFVDGPDMIEGGIAKLDKKVKNRKSIMKQGKYAKNKRRC